MTKSHTQPRSKIVYTKGTAKLSKASREALRRSRSILYRYFGRLFIASGDQDSFCTKNATFYVGSRRYGVYSIGYEVIYLLDMLSKAPFCYPCYEATTNTNFIYSFIAFL